MSAHAQCQTVMIATKRGSARRKDVLSRRVLGVIVVVGPRML